MAFIFAMEIAKRDFLSSAPIVSSTLMMPLFAVVPVIAARLVATFSLASPFAVMSGVMWLLYGDIVDCHLVFCLVCVPWLRVRSVTVSCLLLFIHFLYSSPFPAIRLAIFLHYFEELADYLRWASFQIFSAWAQVHSFDCCVDEGPDRRSEGDEWEPLKFLQENKA